MSWSPRTVGLLAAVVTVLVWTAFIVIARASASHTLLPLDIALMRVLGASSVLLPWAWWRLRAARRRGEFGGSLLGLSPLPLRVTLQAGLFGGLLYAVLAYKGFFYAPASHASVLMPGSLPLWTTLLALWLLHERVSAARALGLAMIITGDLLVGGASLLSAFEGGEVWKGDLLFMAAASCWATYTVLVRRHGVDAISATMAITAMAFVFFVPAYVIGVASGLLPSRLMEAPWYEWAFQALMQGVGSVVISGITFTHMVRHYGPVRSTMITALVPGLSALAAVLLLGEPLHWHLLLGLACVTAGILLGVRAVRPGQPSSTPTPAAEARP